MLFCLSVCFRWLEPLHNHILLVFPSTGFCRGRISQLQSLHVKDDVAYCSWESEKEREWLVGNKKLLVAAAASYVWPERHLVDKIILTMLRKQEVIYLTINLQVWLFFLPRCYMCKNKNNTCKIKHLFSLNIYIFFSSDLIKTPLFTTNKLYKLNEGTHIKKMTAKNIVIHQIRKYFMLYGP